MSEQVGVRGFIEGMKREAPNWAKILPQIPRLLHDYLAPQEDQIKADQRSLRELRHTLRRQRRWLWISTGVSLLALTGAATLIYLQHLS